MRSIDPYQMKRIYAVGHQLSLVGHDHEDELHALVATITGKESVKSLSYREAESVIARLTQLQGGQAPPRPRREREHPSRPGGVTSGQQKKIWALMYELAKYDKKPGSVSLGDRLCAIIKKELGTDAIARTPFAWIDFDSGNKLIEVLKRYVKSAGRGCKDGPVG